MKIWDRYAEYAIIGGFFWAVFFIGAIIVGDSTGGAFKQTWALKIQEFSSFIGNEKPWTQAVFTSLLSALGVIAVFWAGMLIDIVSPIFFTLFEILYFKRYILKKNCNYIKKVFERDKSSSMYRDYEQFSAASTSCWYKHYFQWWSHRHRYIELITLLISYCLKNSESGLLEDLKDRLVLWRTGRSLGGTIVLLALAINGLVIFPVFAVSDGVENIYYAFLSIFILYILSIIISMGQYIRLCNTLRSIMYLIDDNET